MYFKLNKVGTNTAELTLRIKALSFSWCWNQLFCDQCSAQVVYIHAADIGEKLNQPVYAEQIDLHKEQICLKGGC